MDAEHTYICCIFLSDLHNKLFINDYKYENNECKNKHKSMREN